MPQLERLSRAFSLLGCGVTAGLFSPPFLLGEINYPERLIWMSVSARAAMIAAPNREFRLNQIDGENFALLPGFPILQSTMGRPP